MKYFLKSTFLGNVTVKQCGTKYLVKFLKSLNDDGCETIGNSVICYCDVSLCNSNSARTLESNWILSIFGLTVIILNVFTHNKYLN